MIERPSYVGEGGDDETAAETKAARPAGPGAAHAELGGETGQGPRTGRGGRQLRRGTPSDGGQGKNMPWLPDGYSQNFRSYMFGPSGFWTMAPQNLIPSFPCIAPWQFAI